MPIAIYAPVRDLTVRGSPYSLFYFRFCVTLILYANSQSVPTVLLVLDYSYVVCFWRDSPQWARVSSSTRFLDHT